MTEKMWAQIKIIWKSISDGQLASYTCEEIYTKTILMDGTIIRLIKTVYKFSCVAKNHMTF